MMTLFRTASQQGTDAVEYLVNISSYPRLAWTRRVLTTGADVLIVCEGIPDALTAASQGHDAVALLGTAAVSPDTADRIVAPVRAVHDQHVAIAFDADLAGDNAADHLVNLISSSVVVTRLRPAEERGGDLNGWSVQCPDWDRSVATATRGPQTVATPHPGSTPAASTREGTRSVAMQTVEPPWS